MWFNNAQCNSLGTPGKHNLCKWCIRASNKLLLVALRGTIKRGQGKKRATTISLIRPTLNANASCSTRFKKQPSCPESRPLPSAFLSFLSTRRPTKTTNKKLTLLISSSSPSSLCPVFIFPQTECLKPTKNKFLDSAPRPSPVVSTQPMTKQWPKSAT